MYFRCPSALWDEAARLRHAFPVCLALLVIAASSAFATERPLLRVCADPDNMPFSNRQAQGFENKVAELLAAKLGAKLEYAWWAERKSFASSLEQGRCDLVMGIPSSISSVATTRPYYRSSYVFISRKDRGLRISSLNDPRFADWRVGVQVVGENYAPPAAALAHRGITKNIVGFSLFGKYGEENPPRKIIDAVAHGDIDVAIVWGPFGGYFAQRERAALDVVPVSPATFLTIPFTYDISAAVRKGNDALEQALNTAIEADSAEIERILADYDVPRIRP
jgi:mxaJ protein